MNTSERKINKPNDKHTGKSCEDEYLRKDAHTEFSKVVFKETPLKLKMNLQLSMIRTDRDKRVLDQIYSPYSQTNGTQRMCEEVRHSHPKEDPMLGRQHEHSLSMDSSYTRTIFTKSLEISF